MSIRAAHESPPLPCAAAAGGQDGLCRPPRGAPGPAALHRGARQLRERQQGEGGGWGNAAARGEGADPACTGAPACGWQQRVRLSAHPGLWSMLCLQGAPDSLEYRIFFKQQKDGAVVSPWHDIPLFAGARPARLSPAAAAAACQSLPCLGCAQRPQTPQILTVPHCHCTIAAVLLQATAPSTSCARSPRRPPPRWRLPP